MRERLLNAQQVDYEATEWSGEDTSGIQPIGDNVLVLPDTASRKAGKLGLIEVPEDVVERQSLASETGTIVALGPNAFLWSADRARPFEGDKPRPGDRVLFERYAGRIMIGKDGKTYRCLTDKTIGARWL